MSLFVYNSANCLGESYPIQFNICQLPSNNTSVYVEYNDGIYNITVYDDTHCTKNSTSHISKIVSKESCYGYPQVNLSFSISSNYGHGNGGAMKRVPTLLLLILLTASILNCFI
ncbi:unnamed protein product [Cunninghamella echinulata]